MTTTYQSGNGSREYVRLNTLTSWDTDFEKVYATASPAERGSVSQSARDVYNKVAFVSQDPRLVSPAHSGQRLTLDNIPLNGKVQVWETPYIAGYRAASYDTYSNIHGGQNTYYYSKDIAVPFISELFIKPGLVVKEDYVDPMDSYKPHYCMVNIDNKNYPSWLRDSQFHREDLMSKQLWNRNQTNYEVDGESKRRVL